MRLQNKELSMFEAGGESVNLIKTALLHEIFGIYLA